MSRSAERSVETGRAVRRKAAPGARGARRTRKERRIRVAEVPGPVPYGTALEAQRRLARAKIEGNEPDDWLLLLEHRPVVTLGRGARDGRHLGVSEDFLAARGIDLEEIERGGDVTYHGPGQLVGYPILDLRRWRKDLHWYVRTLEEALIRSLAALGLPAFRVGGYTGVWVGGAGGDLPAAEAEPLLRLGRIRKIASIGVHVSRWVTWHGFALNVRREALDAFRLIVPCGIRGVRMTSLASEGVDPSEGELRAAVAAGFSGSFEAEVESPGSDTLGSRSHGPDRAAGSSRDAGLTRAAGSERDAGSAWPARCAPVAEG